MKSPQQIKNEVEKGCGILFHYEDKELGTIHLKCGKWVEINSCLQKMEWCPSCLAKLSILTEYDKAMKEMIEYYFGLQTKRMLKHIEPFGKGNNRDIDGREKGMLLTLPNIFKKELLSKIGDNSEVEK